MKLMIATLGLFFAIPELAKASEKIQHVPEFLGGLNVPNIMKCEKYYKDACHIAGETTAVGYLYKQGLCIAKKMPKDKRCIQAKKLRELTVYPPTEIKKYGSVTVFNITTFADAQAMYYMVDTQGKLIPLTTDLDLNIKNKIYPVIRKKYPNVTLTSSLYWTKIHENLFPQAYLLPNKNQVLIFKQALRDGECVGCLTVGIAFVAYEFDYNGVYLKNRLLKVERTNF